MAVLSPERSTSCWQLCRGHHITQALAPFLPLLGHPEKTRGIRARENMMKKCHKLLFLALFPLKHIYLRLNVLARGGRGGRLNYPIVEYGEHIIEGALL